MITGMTNIAAECLKTPKRSSIWSPQLGQYVCVTTPEGQQALAQQPQAVQAAHPPPISPQFKMVFLTAAGGTLLFAVICLVVSLMAGREPPPLVEKITMGFFDLAKIGFGAVVGLLGGKQLQGLRDAAGT